jgi:hypothetical protein
MPLTSKYGRATRGSLARLALAILRHRRIVAGVWIVLTIATNPAQEAHVPGGRSSNSTVEPSVGRT